MAPRDETDSDTTVPDGSREQLLKQLGQAGRRRVRRAGSELLAISAVAIAIAGCGSTGSAQSSAQPPASSAALSAQTSGELTSSSAAVRAAVRARQSRIGGIVKVAMAIYKRETKGTKLFQQLGRIAGDSVLLNALGRGDMAGAQAEADAQLRSPENHLAHVTRIGVNRGSRVLVNATVNSDGVFVVAPAARTLRLHGHVLGTLLVSLQDVTGFVKLVHHVTGAQVLARGASGHVRTSLHAAIGVRLPSSGHITIAGLGYFVRSFGELGWGNEPLTVWILEQG
jgi:hypothetical protein